MPLGRLKTRLTPRRLVLIAVGGVIWTALLALLVVFNLFQVLSLVVYPVSRRAFRRWNRLLANIWWGACVLVGRFVNRTEIIVTGDDIPDRENAIVVANHQQMPDITVIMDFALRKRRLGDLKFFVKDAIKWVPGVGWGMLFLGCPYLKRDWTRDRYSIERTFRTLVNEKIPAWMVIFAEGTRITPAKADRSRAYAADHGFPRLRHVLLPRPKGFAAAVQGLRNHVAAVYDLTIGYEGGVPDLLQWGTGAVRREHLHVRRFPIETLPHDPAALCDWLRERFVEKDALLERLYTEGRFPGR